MRPFDVYWWTATLGQAADPTHRVDLAVVDSVVGKPEGVAEKPTAFPTVEVQKAENV